MADFNWNDHPIEGSFDWNAHPIESGEEKPWYDVDVKGLAKGAINSLPYAGGIVGGVLGTPADLVAGPLGNAAGAAAGGALGQSAKQALNAAFFPEDAPKTREEMYLDPLKAAGNMATAEAGGRIVGKGIEAAAPYVQNTLEDVATAPLGGDAPRGVLASGLDMVHRAGKGLNGLVDSALQSVTPSTGNGAADQALTGVVKGASKLGRYGLAGKAQGAVDALEYGPKAAQWAAGKVAPLAGKIGESEWVQGLAQRSPQVLESLMKRLEGVNAVSSKESAPTFEKSYGTNALIEKTQGTKYQQVLQNAASRGEQGIASTNFLLQQSDPEYRKLTVGEANVGR